MVDMRLGLERHRVDKVGNLEPKLQEESFEGLRCTGVKGGNSHQEAPPPLAADQSQQGIDD